MKDRDDIFLTEDDDDNEDDEGCFEGDEEPTECDTCVNKEFARMGKFNVDDINHAEFVMGDRYGYVKVTVDGVPKVEYADKPFPNGFREIYHCNCRHEIHLDDYMAIKGEDGSMLFGRVHQFVFGMELLIMRVKIDFVDEFYLDVYLTEVWQDFDVCYAECPPKVENFLKRITMSNPVIMNCGKDYFKFFTEMNCLGAKHMEELYAKFQMNGDARFICHNSDCMYWQKDEAKLWIIGDEDENV